MSQTTANPVYRITEYRETLHVCRGLPQEEQNDGTEIVPDFPTAEQARQAAAEYAKLNPIMIDASRVVGKIGRHVYEVGRHVLDEDGNDCTEMVEIVDVVDPLELHPEIKEAWDRAYESYRRYIDYDYFEITTTFADELEKELGEEWRELDFVVRDWNELDLVVNMRTRRL